MIRFKPQRNGNDSMCLLCGHVIMKLCGTLFVFFTGIDFYENVPVRVCCYCCCSGNVKHGRKDLFLNVYSVAIRVVFTRIPRGRIFHFPVAVVFGVDN